MGRQTSLWWTVVSSWSRGTWTSTTSLLDGKSAALVDLALQGLLRGIGFLRSDHLHESEAARLLGMGVAHDLALLDGTVLGEQASHLILRQAGVDTSDKEVRAGVDGTIVVTVTVVILDRSAAQTIRVSPRSEGQRKG